MMFHEAAEEKFQRGAQEHGDWDQIDHIAEIKDELLDLYNYASKDPRDLRMSFSNGGVATFKRNGVYNYRPKGAWGIGHYTISNNRVCADFPKAKRSHCWTYFREGNGYYLLSGKNQRRVDIRSIR